MRSFAQKPKVSQQTESAKSAQSHPAHLRQYPRMSLPLNLQHGSDNHAARRLPRADSEDRAVVAETTEQLRWWRDFSQSPLYSSSGAGSEGGADRGATAGQTDKHHPVRPLVAPAPVHPEPSAIRGGGQPLPNDLRGRFERQLGFDLKRVRIHTGAAAERSAATMAAHAYTVGADIAFARGAFNPGTGVGRRLLAHEVAHVVQQLSTPATTQGAHVRAVAHDDRAEATARDVARAIEQHTASPTILPTGPALQREAVTTLESQIEAKLQSAYERFLPWRRKNDLHDALVLLRTLDSQRLRALVAQLDTPGRLLLDTLDSVSDDDRKEFSDVLSRIAVLRNTLLEYAVVTDPTQSKFSIASRPPDTVWHAAGSFESVAEMASEANAFVSQRGMKIGSLGILAHGDSFGTIQMGSDIVQNHTFDSFQSSFKALGELLAPDADVYIYGCVSGAGALGTALLKKLSRALPGRRIIGFNVINVVDPESTLVKSESRFSPRLLTSEVQTTLEFKKRNAREPSKFYQTLKPATANSAHAKWVRDGVVLKWPALADEARQSHPPGSEYETPEIDGVEVDKPVTQPPQTPRPRRRGR